MLVIILYICVILPHWPGLISGLSCPACPDECETTVYSAQVSTAHFQADFSAISLVGITPDTQL